MLVMLAPSQVVRLTRPLCSWNSPGKNTELSCHSLLQGIFLVQGSNVGLLHCRQILYHLRHYGRGLKTYSLIRRLSKCQFTLTFNLFTILKMYFLKWNWTSLS